MKRALLLSVVTATVLSAAETTAPDATESPQRPAPAREARRSGSLPTDATVLRNLEYIPDGGERNRLDLYLPADTNSPSPVVVWVHGGAWLAGSKEQCPARFLVAQGYAVASINYRLSQQAVFPAQIEDCKAAIRWLRAHAAQHHLAPNRFAAWGASAGGHLVALLGTTSDDPQFDVGENLDQSSRVQAVVDWFGPTDFTQMGKFSLTNSPIDHDAPNAPEALLIGGPVQANKDKARRANPLTYISSADPPFLIMHGNRDNIVPYQQSELLDDALQKAGVPVTLEIIDGAGHGFGGPGVNQTVLDFLNEQLKATH